MKGQTDMKHNDPHDAILRAPFDALRGELESIETPPAIQARLMAAFAKQHPKRHWYQMRSWPRLAVAGGMGSSALALLLLLSLHKAPQRDDANPAPHIGGDGANAFIALESRERILQEPSPRLIEADLPRTLLASFGMPLTPENAGQLVRAELLVSAGGEPLALRFVPN